MLVGPFLSRPPRKFLEDPEERKFWEQHLQHIESIRTEINRLSESANSDQGGDNFGGQQEPDRGGDSTSDTFGGREVVGFRGKTFNEVTISGTRYNASADDNIFATAEAIIVLPNSPPSGAQVFVNTGDFSLIRIITEDKNINGEREIQISTSGSFLEFLYSPISDEWRLR